MFQINSLLSLTTILLGVLFVANTNLASPTATVLGNLSPLPHEPKSRRHASRNRLPALPPSSILTPRADSFGVLPITSLLPGWELDFYAYDWGYLPLATASTMLEIFYTKVFEYAVTATGSIPEHVVLFSLGQLDLEVRSSTGAVAWESVASFAAHMLRTAKRGYTNSYHCHMTNVAAGVFISFNLYVRAARQTAAVEAP